MPRPKNPTAYHPLIARIWEEARREGSYASGPITPTAASALRFDLYSYRKGLIETDPKEHELIAGFSIRLIKVAPSDAGSPAVRLIIDPAPQWALGPNFQGVVQGLKTHEDEDFESLGLDMLDGGEEEN